MAIPTPLVIYGLTAATSTLSTANKLVAISGSATNTAATTLIGTSTQYGEIYSQGNAGAWAGSGSIGNPSGHGWLWDVTTLEAQQMLAGSWTPVLKMNQSGVLSVIADIYIRAYKRSSGGVYTQIGCSMVLSAQSFASGAATYTFGQTVLPVTTFATGDKLYIDCWLNITTNSSVLSTATISNYDSSNTTQGQTSVFQITTPGYEPSLSLTNTVGSTTTGTAFVPGVEHQCWLLPDNSLVFAFQTGAAGTNSTFSSSGVILVQSTNWQTSTPTWTFVKQLSSSTTARGSLWWDAANTRLHTVTGVNGTSGAALSYISATYSSGTWIWDNSSTSIGGSTASFPCICVDANGLIFVSYRNNASSTFSIQVVVYTSSWQAAQQLSSTTGTSSMYYSTLIRSGTNTIIVTMEGVTSGNGDYYATVHQDGSAYNSWGTKTAGPTAFPQSTNTYGPLAALSPSSGSVWVSMSSDTGTAGKKGLSVINFTFSGTTITWGSVTQLDGSQITISSGQWLQNNTLLYLFFHKLTAPNTSDISYYTYNPQNTTWSAVQNLTNASANNNITPAVPLNYPTVAATQNIPYVYEVGSATTYMELGILPTPYKDIATRIRLYATNVKDVATRIRLYATNTKDVATRLRLLAVGTKDVATRVRLYATQTKDIATRLRLLTVATKDVATRVRLSITNTADIATRIRLLSVVTQDIASRLRLLVTNVKDVATRLRLYATNIQDVATRLRLFVTTTKDIATRIRLFATQTKDIASRLRLLAVVTGDIASRIRLSVTRTQDIASRVRLFVTQTRDIASRVRLSVTSTRDIATRVRLFVTHTQDIATRIRLFGLQTRDIASRIRLSITNTKDIASRIRLQGKQVHDVATRLRLLVIHTNDIASRVRLFGLATKDISTRIRLRMLGDLQDDPLTPSDSMTFTTTALFSDQLTTSDSLTASSVMVSHVTFRVRSGEVTFHGR